MIPIRNPIYNWSILSAIILASIAVTNTADAQVRPTVGAQKTDTETINHTQKDLVACKFSTVSKNDFSNKLMEITAKGVVTQSRTGIKLISWENMLRVDFPNTGNHHSGAEILQLTNGDRLVVKVRNASEEKLKAEWYQLPGWSPLNIDLICLRAIYFSLPEQVTKKNLLVRKLLNDSQKNELILLRNGDRQRGEFQKLDQSQLTLHNGKIDRSNILGIRFDPRFSETPKSSPSRLVIFLKNGSKLTGTIQLSSLTNSIKLKTEWGVSIEIPMVSIQGIEFWDASKVPLSSLKPLEYRFTPYFSGKWTYQKNANVLGGPLRIRSQESSTGIGMHSQSEMTFALNQKYQSFQTWIGIDDDASGKGNVIFTMKLDGKIVFRSTHITGRGEAIRIKSLDVSKAKKMTLIVEFGNEADVADYANWFHATLIRK